MKKSFGAKIKESILFLADMFKEYPFTLGIIMAIAILNMIFMEGDHLQDAREIYEKLNIYLIIFGAQSLFVEEHFSKYRKNEETTPLIYWIGEAAAFLIAIPATYLIKMDTGSFNKLSDFSGRFFSVYSGVLVVLAIYHMYKRLEDDFETYCIKAFCACFKSSIIYGLFALGIAIIVLIFEELIADTGHFLSRAEIFLAAGIYVPMILSCLSKAGEEIGKFAKVVFLYVLQPILLAAFLIIYIYIFKIIFAMTLPSNVVFDILAFLFAIGMPIWTMAMAFNDTEYENKLSLLAKFVPYAYIPFIILQCICIGLRIKDYGVTEERYYAVALIVFEVIYFVIYILQVILKKNLIALNLFVACAMSVVIFVLPFVNVYDASLRSQMARLEQMLKIENPTDMEKGSIYGLYHTIKSMGGNGKLALEEKYSKEKIEMIVGYSEYNQYSYGNYYPVEYITISILREGDEFIIGPYSYMIKVQTDVTNPAKSEDIVVTDRGEEFSYIINSFVEDMIKNTGNIQNTYREYSPEGVFELDAHTGFICTNGHVRIQEETLEIQDCFLEGYILLK